MFATKMQFWSSCQLVLLLTAANVFAAIVQHKSNGSLCVESVGVKSASKAFGNMLKGYVAPKSQSELANSHTEKLKKENPNYHVNQVGQAWLLNPNASALKPVAPGGGDTGNVGPILVPKPGVTIRVIRPLTFPPRPTTTGAKTTTTTAPTTTTTATPVPTIYHSMTMVTDRIVKEGEIETPFPDAPTITSGRFCASQIIVILLIIT